MGIHLRPDHYSEAGKKGWVKSSYDNFIRNIEVGNLDLGYWGSRTSNSVNAPDAHSPIYSIPNPWASAYLFSNVLGDNNHPLSDYLIIQILNALSDISIFGRLELLKIDIPAQDSAFNKFWVMAPEFIKYNNSMWFLREIDTHQVIGGLSKNSLFWISQQYIGEGERDDFIQNQSLKALLLQIKRSHNPVDSNYNAFWSHNLMVEMLANPERIGSQFEYTQIENSPVEWLKRVTIRGFDSDFKDSESGCIVLDYDLLRSNPQILSVINPPGFIEKIKTEKGGSNLPLNMGQCNWLILDEFIEPYWVRNDKVEHSSGNFVRSLEGDFLYPCKPEYLTRYKLKLGDLRTKDKITSGPQNASADIVWKEKNKIRLNTVFQDDTRSISIWPPFQSEHTVNYIIEYSISGISKLKELEFYSESGSNQLRQVQKIEQEPLKFYEEQNFRIYKLARKKFPKYIRILKEFQNEQYGGFFEVNEKPKGEPQGDIVIGIDFGTSHTSVFYRKHDRIKKMLFEQSSPLIIADESSKDGMLYNFLPLGLSDSKPITELLWEKKIPWQPFQTQWMDFSSGNLKSKFLQDGNIPFMHYSGEATTANLYSNLKWGADDNIITYRELFLKQLLLMILIEVEAIGCAKVEINWSYPKSFSSDQINLLKSFWCNDTLIIF